MKFYIKILSGNIDNAYCLLIFENRGKKGDFIRFLLTNNKLKNSVYSYYLVVTSPQEVITTHLDEWCLSHLWLRTAKIKHVIYYDCGIYTPWRINYPFYYLQIKSPFFPVCQKLVVANVARRLMSRFTSINFWTNRLIIFLYSSSLNI